MAHELDVGTLILSLDGSFTYVLALSFRGLVTFTYHAKNGATDPNTATVNARVLGPTGRLSICQS